MEEDLEAAEAALLALSLEMPAASWSGCSSALAGGCPPGWYPAMGVCEGVAGGAGERRELVELVRLRAPRSITKERRSNSARGERGGRRRRGGTQWR